MAKRTSAMGSSNPLRDQRAATQMVDTNPPAPEKVRMNLYLEADLVEYLRDAIHGTGNRFTLGDVIGQALPYGLRDLEREYNNGEQFPRRPKEAAKLRTGPAPKIPSRSRP